MVSWVTFGSMIGVLLTFLGILEVQCEKINYQEETGHVFTTIFHKYSERVRPYNHNKDPLDISVILSIVRVNDLDPATQQLDVTVDLSITWTDTRLTWFFDTVDYIEVNQSSVWTPDVTFLDTMAGSEALINPRYLVVLRNGRIVWYRRLRSRILCEVNETASVQECNIRMGSKQFPDTELQFKEGTCNTESKLENMKWEITSVNNTMEISTIPLPTNLAFRTGEMSMAQCGLSIEWKTPTRKTSVASELQAGDPEDQKAGASRLHLEVLVLVSSLLGLLFSV
ncbi:acetylcholine receptor subunit alpha-like [Ylistrum balloti]|uniref:acetylcholine receptor subunit alpha-like n=1 Tax=Ylistrum balloti TaxID=509963 RepID=UPI0029058C56|nr:acetylcholine receptor subunit alpha-like [Ylistrum balloti]